MDTVHGWSALYEDFCDSSVNFSSLKILTVWDPGILVSIQGCGVDVMCN